jgi:hypothetical protein
MKVMARLAHRWVEAHEPAGEAQDDAPIVADDVTQILSYVAGVFTRLEIAVPRRRKSFVFHV